LGTLRIICRPRLQFLDASKVLGRFGQLEHLVDKFVHRFEPGREIIVGLLHIRRRAGQTKIAYANLHAADRRFRIDRVPRDRLLRRHARLKIARRRIGPHLDDHHRGNKHNAKPRGDAELGADGQIQNEASDTGHELRP
jgi:hypothetical protein